MTPEAHDNEIILTRLVDAPRERVWHAWTEPRHLEQWWGPDGFSVTTQEIDVREGGTWRFIMHGPDGRDYPNHIVFTELKEPERICHDHGGDGKDGAEVHFKAVITFEEQLHGKTLITMKSIFRSATERAHVVKEYGAIEGGNQTLGRMADYVGKMSV